METILDSVPDINGKKLVNIEPLIEKSQLAKWQIKDHAKINGYDIRDHHPHFNHIAAAKGMWIEESSVKAIVENLELSTDYTIQFKDSFIKQKPMQWKLKSVAKDDKYFVDIEPVRKQFYTTSERVKQAISTHPIENFLDASGWWFEKDYDGIRRIFLDCGWSLQLLTRF